MDVADKFHYIKMHLDRVAEHRDEDGLVRQGVLAATKDYCDKLMADIQAEQREKLDSVLNFVKVEATESVDLPKPEPEDVPEAPPEPVSEPVKAAKATAKS